VYVFEVTPKVSALCEGLLAHCTGKRPLASVLAEVISQIAALLEDALAPCVPAFKIQFDALSSQVFDLNCLVPLLRDSLESFGLNARDYRVFTEL